MNDESEELIISQQNLTIRNLDDFVAFFFCFKEHIWNNSNTMDDNKCDFVSTMIKIFLVLFL